MEEDASSANEPLLGDQDNGNDPSPMDNKPEQTVVEADKGTANVEQKKPEEEEEEEEEEDGEDMSFLKNRPKSGVLLLVDKKSAEGDSQVTSEKSTNQQPEMPSKEFEEAPANEQSETVKKPEKCEQEKTAAEGDKENDQAQVIPVEIAMENDADLKEVKSEKKAEEAPKPDIQQTTKTTTTKESHTTSWKFESSFNSNLDGKATNMAKEMLAQLESDMANLKTVRTANTAISSNDGEPVKITCETESVVTKSAPLTVESVQRKDSNTAMTQTAAPKEKEEEVLIQIPIKVEIPPQQTEASDNFHKQATYTDPHANVESSSSASRVEMSSTLTPSTIQVTTSPGGTTKKTVSRTETKKTYITTKRHESSSDWIQQESVSKNNWISGAPWTRTIREHHDNTAEAEPIGQQRTVGKEPSAKEVFHKTMTTTTRTEKYSSDGRTSPEHWVNESKQVYSDASPQMAMDSQQQSLQDFVKRFNISNMSTVTPNVPQPSLQQQPPSRPKQQEVRPEPPPATTLQDFKKRFEQHQEDNQPHVTGRYSYTRNQQVWHSNARAPQEFPKAEPIANQYSTQQYSTQWQDNQTASSPKSTHLGMQAPEFMRQQQQPTGSSPYDVYKHTYQSRSQSYGQQPLAFGQEQRPVGSPVAGHQQQSFTSNLAREQPRGEPISSQEQQYDHWSQPVKHQWSVASTKRQVTHKQ